MNFVRSSFLLLSFLLFLPFQPASTCQSGCASCSYSCNAVGDAARSVCEANGGDWETCDAVFHAYVCGCLDQQCPAGCEAMKAMMCTHQNLASVKTPRRWQYCSYAGE
jgi:hypothetical protein